MRTVILLVCLWWPSLLLGEDWKLGSTQLSGIISANTITGRGGAQPSAGFDVTIGTSKYLAVTGGYAYNRLASLSQPVCTSAGCIWVTAGAVAHELMGGLRVNAQNRSRITPYLLAVGGVVQLRASGKVAGISVSVSESKPAFGAGAGMDVRLAGPVALILDLQVVYPREMNRYARAGVGIGIRHK